jgi:hypothetical protein
VTWEEYLWVEAQDISSMRTSLSKMGTARKLLSHDSNSRQWSDVMTRSSISSQFISNKGRIMGIMSERANEEIHGGGTLPSTGSL